MRRILMYRYARDDRRRWPPARPENDDVRNGDTCITFTIRRRKGDDSYNLGASTVKVRVIDDETP